MDIPVRHATPLAKCKCGNNAAVTAGPRYPQCVRQSLGVKLRDEDAVLRISLSYIDVRTIVQRPAAARRFRILLKYSRAISSVRSSRETKEYFPCQYRRCISRLTASDIICKGVPSRIFCSFLVDVFVRSKPDEEEKEEIIESK